MTLCAFGKAVGHKRRAENGNPRSGFSYIFGCVKGFQHVAERVKKALRKT